MSQEIFVLVVCASAFAVELLLVTKVSSNSNKTPNSNLRKQVILEPFVQFHSSLSSSGRNLHLPVLWLLRQPESAGIFLPFVNVWLWAGCLVRLTLTWFHRFLLLKSWTMHRFLWTFNSGWFCRHHHQRYDRKETISFLQTLLEIFHSSHIIRKTHATVAGNTPFMRAECQVYPDWTYVLGFIITLSSVLIMPLFALFQIYMTPGTIREVSINWNSVYHINRFNIETW